MATESSDEDMENWVFYRDRDEWKDVVPIEQDDGPFPVVAIAYTEKCKSLNNHTRFFFTSVTLNLYYCFVIQGAITFHIRISPLSRANNSKGVPY